MLQKYIIETYSNAIKLLIIVKVVLMRYICVLHVTLYSYIWRINKINTQKFNNINNNRYGTTSNSD